MIAVDAGGDCNFGCVTDSCAVERLPMLVPVSVPVLGLEPELDGRLSVSACETGFENDVGLVAMPYGGVAAVVDA